MHYSVHQGGTSLEWGGGGLLTVPPIRHLSRPRNTLPNLKHASALSKLTSPWDTQSPNTPVSFTQGNAASTSQKVPVPVHPCTSAGALHRQWA